MHKILVLLVTYTSFTPGWQTKLDDPYYKLPSDILVTGSHYVKDGDTFKQVKDLPDAEATTQVDSVVYCLVTSDHKIPVGDYIFWDWEDNLVVQ